MCLYTYIFQVLKLEGQDLEKQRKKNKFSTLCWYKSHSETCSTMPTKRKQMNELTSYMKKYE